MIKTIRRWLSLITILSVVYLTAACAAPRFFQPGDCFKTRGTGSIGQVMDAQDGHYTIKLLSNRANTLWLVRKGQLHMDVLPRHCVE